MTKAKVVKEEEKKAVIPKYAFVVKEGDENVSPVNRTIAKTMEVTEEFTTYNTIKYIAGMKKQVSDKEIEIESLKKMIELYEAEMKLIEDELGVMDLEGDYQKEVSAKNQAETEAKLKEELLKTGNFVEKE